MDNTFSNGQRLYEVLKKFKKQIAMLPLMPELRPRELMMLHSVLRLTKHPPNESGKQPRNAAGVTISDLSVFVDQTPSAVSQTVKALELKGLLERSLSSTDRRIVYVSLTPSGRKIFLEAERVMSDRLDHLIHLLGQEDTDQLIALLNKLADALESSRESNVDGGLLPPAK